MNPELIRLAWELEQEELYEAYERGHLWIIKDDAIKLVPGPVAAVIVR